MAKLYYDPAGNPIALARDDDEEARRFTAPPAGQHANSPFVFDETTNQAVIDSLTGAAPGFAWQDHKVVAGALQRKGAALGIAADAPATTDRKQIKASLPALFAALRAGTATAAQQQRVLAFLLRQFLQG